MNFNTPKNRKRNMTFGTPTTRLPTRFDKSTFTPIGKSTHKAKNPATPLRAPCSPLFKSINPKPQSPIKMDVVTSDWVLGTDKAGNPSAPGSPQKNRAAGRTNSHADRFIPNRQASGQVRSKLEKTTIVVSTGSGNGTQGSSSSSTLTGSGVSLDFSGSGQTAYAQEKAKNSESPTSIAYQSSVAKACGIALNTRILEFQPAAPHSSRAVDLRSQYNKPLKTTVDPAFRRKVPTTPDRVLDAPGLIDDYYLHLLDWSCNNQIAIALENSVYIWDASSGGVSSLMESSVSNYITGIRWSGDGAYISIGLNNGDIQIWDVEEGVRTRNLNGHTSRVGVMSWDKHFVSSGCHDGSIWNHDVRCQNHKVSEFTSHTAEVCGLEWRSDGGQLASGGNDNVVNIWDPRSSVPRFTKTSHRGAVRAVAWCPWQSNLLATGGGTEDKQIHFWNTTTGARVNSVNTESQVTSLTWSTIYKEIVSTHGYPNNTLSIWSYPNLTKVIDIAGHDSRVLHSALSPDGQTLATCASDENLKFWKIFEAAGKHKPVSSMRGKGLSSDRDDTRAMIIR